MAAPSLSSELAPDGRRMVHAENREQWRVWLGAHHVEPHGVWLVSWKKATGRPAVAYGDAVEEGLCVGWVDSKPGKLDDERTLLWFAPRKAGYASPE